MKEFLFLIGTAFFLGTSISLIVKTVSRMVDPNERLFDKLPPYWLHAVTVAIGAVCLGVSYFCF